MFEYCRKSNKRKKKEVPYSSQYHEELDGEDPVVYEEVGTLNICSIAPLELVAFHWGESYFSLVGDTESIKVSVFFSYGLRSNLVILEPNLT
jgi:hypothetical protein